MSTTFSFKANPVDYIIETNGNTITKIYLTMHNYAGDVGGFITESRARPANCVVSIAYLNDNIPKISTSPEMAKQIAKYIKIYCEIKHKKTYNLLPVAGPIIVEPTLS
jgi:hypothetical protein